MKRKLLSIFLTAVMLTCSLLPQYSALADNRSFAEKIKISIDKNAEKNRINSISSAGKNKINIVTNGKSDFILMADTKADPAFNGAIELFCDTFEQMTGVDLKEQKGDDKSPVFLFDIQKGLDLKGGFDIKISDNGVFITSDTYEGLSNGIYTFMEDKLGCMFLSPESTYIPTQKTIWLEKEERSITPATEWRDVYAKEVLADNWSARLKLNGVDTSFGENADESEEKQYKGWGTWCHSCYTFLSPDEYFDTHHEYFSEINSKRVCEYKGRDAYLCLSNPEVFEIVKNSLAEKIKENPQAMYWDFSGSDNPSLAGCQCAECKKADEEAGGTGMGTLLPFLNKLAKAFPDKYISTLAYLHTLKAPKGIKAEPNVVIKLCSMPGDQASSYNSGKTSGALEFKNQVEEWNEVCDNIVIWDYVVNFANLVIPFPNFAVQVQNQKFYEEHNVKGIFHQASREDGGEMTYMRAYILSALMWEGSSMDIEEKMSRYISLYYGDGAEYVAQYINSMADELYTSCLPLGLYDGLYNHYNGYLSLDNINKYLSLIKDAENAVKNDETLYNRTQQIELSVQYAKMLHPDISKQERNEAKSIVDSLCKKFNVTMAREWESFDEFFDTGLNKELRKTNIIIYKTEIIAVSVTAGVILIALIATVVTVAINKKRKK